MEVTPTSITQHLEGFIHSAKKLEDALADERRRSQKIAQDYLSTRTTLEAAVRDLQSRITQRENKIEAISEALRSAQLSEVRLKEELREVSEREKKLSSELKQYQTAWNEVLARESNARGAILENEQTKRLVNDQRNQLLALEKSLKETNEVAVAHSRRAEACQRELQITLGRIETAESKAAQAQKELAAALLNQKQVGTEVARIQAEMKERFHALASAEKNRLQGEFRKFLVTEKERIQEPLESERASHEKTRADLAEAINQKKEADHRHHIDMERARARLLALSEEAHTARVELKETNLAKLTEVSSAVERSERSDREVASLRGDLAILKMKAAQAEAQAESQKKEASKSLLMERIKFEKIMGELNDKLDRLMTDGLYAEKVEGAPEDVAIYVAHPASTESSLQN